MIVIDNICPVCGNRRQLVFLESERGDDLPEDSPWRVVCGSCQNHLADYFRVEESRRSERRFMGIMNGCVNQRERSIQTARQIVQSVRTIQRQLKLDSSQQAHVLEAPLSGPTHRSIG